LERERERISQETEFLRRQDQARKVSFKKQKLEKKMKKVAKVQEELLAIGRHFCLISASSHDLCVPFSLLQRAESLLSLC